MQGDEQRCLEAGCSGYLTKPIDIPRLLQVIGNALDSPEKPAAKNLVTPPANAQVDHDSPIHSTLPTDVLAFQVVVERFITQLPTKIDEIQNSIDQADWQQVAEQAHALAGSGGTVGFECFTKPAKKLEKVAKANDKTAAQNVLQEIQSLAKRLVVPQVTNKV